MLAHSISSLSSLSGYAQIFICLFLFRYTRLLANIVGYLIYKPTPIPDNPVLTSKDVTVIVATVDPFNPDFAECIKSIAATSPATLIIVTAGGEKHFHEAARYRQIVPKAHILVISSSKVDKRHQITLGLRHVRTSVTMLADDHVFWPPAYLSHVLVPFHNPSVGAVGTAKRGRRTCPPGTFTWVSFWNLMGVLFMERCNFDTRATNSLDGGVYVLTGRTAAYRTSILKDPAFKRYFLEEYACFGKLGPLSADDDNCLTRWVVNQGWKIKIQALDGKRKDEALLGTILGGWPKYVKQCLRWSRTTWRSNPKALFTERTVYRAQPYSTYAIFISHLANFALFYDAAMLFTLYQALLLSNTGHTWILALLLWILSTKLVKVGPYFAEHPRDLVLLPGYILFGYFHSLIKLYALLTVWNHSWSGRKLDGMEGFAAESSSNGLEDDGMNDHALVQS